MRKVISQINAEIVDFYPLSLQPDPVIFERLDLLARLSKKPLFDRKVKYNSGQVVREPGRLTVRLLLSKRGKEPVLAAQCCFIPPAAGKKGFTPDTA